MTQDSNLANPQIAVLGSKSQLVKMTKQIDRSFTQNLLSVIKETKGNVSNMELVEKIASNMAHAFEKYS
jgi:hypothetical protein